MEPAPYLTSGKMDDIDHVDDKASDQLASHTTIPYDHHRTAEERATALRLAQQADPGPAWGDWRNICFIFTALCTCLCGGDTGFDGTVMSSINSMTQYQQFFHLEAASSKTGIIFGIYTIGSIVAFFPASYLPDRIGRRRSMFLGNVSLVTGAILTGLAQNMGMFLGGRFLTGLGCTMAAIASKTYMAEITSPKTRGFWLGLLNSFYFVGQIFASGIAIPFGRRNSNWAWRTPILCQCIMAVINLIFVLYLFESPRWLYSRGRTEEAAVVLARYHTRDNDVNSPLVQLGIEEFEESISLAGADKRFWDFRALLATASSRYRFGLCLIVACWGQLSGNSLVTYFLPVLLQQAGIKSPDRQRVLNFVNSVTSMVGALAGTAVVDRVGRRKMLLTASISCMMGMAIVAGISSPAGHASNTRANAGITFIYLFAVFYSFGWTPLQGLYPSEVLSFENRSKGLSLQTIAAQVFGLINTFGMPSALAALTWKTYIIFACWNAVGIAVIYHWAVETKQLSLEDMDSVFADRHPKKKSFELARDARAMFKAQKEVVLSS